MAAALSPLLGHVDRLAAGRADRAHRIRLPGPPGAGRGGRQPSPSWASTASTWCPSPSGWCRSACWPSRWWAPSAGTAPGLGHRVPVPVDPGREAGHDRRPRVARRRRAAERRPRRRRPSPAPASSSPSTSRSSTWPSRPWPPRSWPSHATGGTAVIMDVKTGDILAMANLTADKPARRRPRRRRPRRTGHTDRPRGRHAEHVGRHAGGPGRHPAGRGVGGTLQLGGDPGLRARVGVQAGDLLGRPGRRRGHARPRR